MNFLLKVNIIGRRGGGLKRAILTEGCKQEGRDARWGVEGEVKVREGVARREDMEREKK